MHGQRLLGAAGFALLLAFACGGSSSGGSGQASATPDPNKVLKTIEMNATEFSFGADTTITLDKPGTYEFRLTNQGKFPHALEIEGSGLEEKTATLQPNGTETLKASLKSGTYEFYCPVGNHRQAGMEGKLVVR
jgi:plastocyanin